MTEPDAASANNKTKFRTHIVAGLIILVFSISAGVSLGAISIPFSTVWGVVINNMVSELIDIDWSKGREAIVWDIRLPRTILACFVGAGLALVGASLQAVTRNPLADPHLLGISAAGLGFPLRQRPRGIRVEKVRLALSVKAGDQR